MAMFAYFCPYKNNYFSIIDCLAFALGFNNLLDNIYYVIEANSFPIELLYVVGLTPFLYLISFILYKILSQVALCRTCCSRIREKIQARKENQHLHIPRDDNIDDHRLVNAYPNFDF